MKSKENDNIKSTIKAIYDILSKIFQIMAIIILVTFTASIIIIAIHDNPNGIEIYIKNIYLYAIGTIALSIIIIWIFEKTDKIKTNITTFTLIVIITSFFMNMLIIGWIYKGIDKFSFDYNLKTSLEEDKFIKAIEMKNSFIKIEDKSCKTYKLKLDYNKIFHEQPFNSMKYTRSLAETITHDRIENSNICKKIKLLQQGFPISSITNSIEEGKYLKAFQNIFKVMLESQGEYGIYIKGYADTEKSPWQRKLSKDHFYEDISYFSADSKDSYTISKSSIRNHHVPSSSEITSGHYTNSDLPYLRAQYVYKTWFKDFLENCLQHQASGGILEGTILPAKIPTMRNTEIYLTSCTKKTHQGCSKK